MIFYRLTETNTSGTNMAGFDTDILKVIIPAATGLLGAVGGVLGGYYVKRWELERGERNLERTSWLTQKQTHWLPVLRAAREFKARLEFLRDIYEHKPNTPFDPASLSADFREIYTLNRAEIGDFQSCDANGPRRSAIDVENIRSRVCHELTFAESTLYITITYLGYAEHAWRGLNQGILILSDEARNEALLLLLKVRESLQGPSGAGIFREQQEYMGEAVWSAAGGVISNLEFRDRLFDLPGWQTFKNLLRFYADLSPKIGYEVGNTIETLDDLIAKIDQLRASADAKAYDSLRKIRSQPNANV